MHDAWCMMRCIVKYDQIYSNIVNYEVYVLYGIQMHEVKNDTKSGGSSHRQIFKLSQRAKTMIFIRRNDKTKEDKKTKQYMRKNDNSGSSPKLKLMQVDCASQERAEAGLFSSSHRWKLALQFFHPQPAFSRLRHLLISLAPLWPGQPVDIRDSASVRVLDSLVAEIPNKAVVVHSVRIIGLLSQTEPYQSTRGRLSDRWAVQSGMIGQGYNDESRLSWRITSWDVPNRTKFWTFVTVSVQKSWWQARTCRELRAVTAGVAKGVLRLAQATFERACPVFHRLPSYVWVSCGELRIHNCMWKFSGKSSCSRIICVLQRVFSNTLMQHMITMPKSSFQVQAW